MASDSSESEDMSFRLPKDRPSLNFEADLEYTRRQSSIFLPKKKLIDPLRFAELRKKRPRSLSTRSKKLAATVNEDSYRRPVDFDTDTEHSNLRKRGRLEEVLRKEKKMIRSVRLPLQIKSRKKREDSVTAKIAARNVPLDSSFDESVERVNIRKHIKPQKFATLFGAPKKHVLNSPQFTKPAPKEIRNGKNSKNNHQAGEARKSTLEPAKERRVNEGVSFLNDSAYTPKRDWKRNTRTQTLINEDVVAEANKLTKRKSRSSSVPTTRTIQAKAKNSYRRRSSIKRIRNLTEHIETVVSSPDLDPTPKGQQKKQIVRRTSLMSRTRGNNNSTTQSTVSYQFQPSSQDIYADILTQHSSQLNKQNNHVGNEHVASSIEKIISTTAATERQSDVSPARPPSSEIEQINLLPEHRTHQIDQYPESPVSQPRAARLKNLNRTPLSLASFSQLQNVPNSVVPSPIHFDQGNDVALPPLLEQSGVSPLVSPRAKERAPVVNVIQQEETEIALELQQELAKRNKTSLSSKLRRVHSKDASPVPLSSNEDRQEEEDSDDASAVPVSASRDNYVQEDSQVTSARPSSRSLISHGRGAASFSAQRSDRRPGGLLPALAPLKGRSKISSPKRRVLDTSSASSSSSSEDTEEEDSDDASAARSSKPKGKKPKPKFPKGTLDKPARNKNKEGNRTNKTAKVKLPRRKVIPEPQLAVVGEDEIENISPTSQTRNIRRQTPSPAQSGEEGQENLEESAAPRSPPRRTKRRRKVNRRDSWGPDHPIMEGRGKALYNKKLVSNDLVKETLRRYVPDSTLTSRQLSSLQENLNTYIEVTFNSLCDTTPLFYGVWTFQQLMRELKEKELLNQNTTRKDFIIVLKDTVGEKGTQKCEGFLYPNVGQHDTLDIYN